MKTVLQYLNVYRLFFSTSLTGAIQFRTSFFLLVLLDLFFFGTSLATVDLLYRHVEVIGTWDRSQLMFFMIFVLWIDHLHMACISFNFWMLSDHIRTGNLDFILLRPIGSVFQSFFRMIRPSSFVSTPFMLWLLIYYGRQVGLSWLDWLLIPPLILLGLALLVLIEILLSTAMFWMVESIGINFVRMELQRLSRWPEFVYASIPRKVFLLLVPVLLVGSGPAHFLLGTDKGFMLLGMIAGIVVFGLLVAVFWRLALKSYESASS